MITAALVSAFVALFIAILLPLAGPQMQMLEEKARERRMAEHRMNARLLRFDI